MLEKERLEVKELKVRGLKQKDHISAGREKKNLLRIGIFG